MRVADDDASLAAQRESLERAGCDRVFVDQSTVDVWPASGWQALVSSLDAGDQLVVPNLEQLAFTLDQLAEILAELIERRINLSVCDWRLPFPFDTVALRDVVVRLDAFERAGRRVLTNAGLSAARSEGRLGGRPHKLAPAQIAELKQMMGELGADPVEVGKRFGLSRASVYKYLKR